MPKIFALTSIICIVLISVDVGGIVTLAISGANAIAAMLTGWVALKGMKIKKNEPKS